MSERDFKGVWIPKELWLNDELTLLEKCIFTEIDSLDNDNHCIASNEYFANFCNCSESKITKAIRHLQELKMIEIMSFDGRHRKIRVVKSMMQSSKKYDAESQKVRASNIYNNTNNKSLSKDKDNTKNFEFGKTVEHKKSLYDRCVNHINSFTENREIKELLFDFLNSLSEMKKLRGENQFVGILKKLKDYGDTDEKQIKIIQYTIEHGYSTFYEYKEFTKKSNVSSDIGKHAKRLTAEEKQRAREAIANGTAEKY